MAIKQHLWKNALNLQLIQEKIRPILFHAIRSTKHFVDRVSVTMVTICKDPVSWTNMVSLALA